MQKTGLLVLVVALSMSVEAAAKSKLDRLMNADMLGTQRAYLEKIAGVAKRVNGAYRQYDIGGCLVGVTEDKTQTISSIQLENVSARCSFDSAGIFLQGPAHKLTFGRLNEMNIGGGAIESCFGLCGNAIEPSYGLAVQTPHVMNFIEYDASVGYNNESGAAAQRLESKLQKRYPGVELYGEYLGKQIPKKAYTEMWLNEFRNVRITSIRFGYNIVGD